MKKKKKPFKKQNTKQNKPYISSKQKKINKKREIREKNRQTFLELFTKIEPVETQKERKLRRAKELEQEKIKFLLENGLELEEAGKLKRKSWKSLNDYLSYDNRVYTSEYYAIVYWWDKTGEGNIADALAESSLLTTDELIYHINQMYLNAKAGDSDGFQGVAKFAYGKKSDVEKLGENFIRRGYGEAVPFNATKVAYGNQFTVRGFARMLYSVMSLCSGDYQIAFYNQLNNFSAKYLPEIHALVFKN